LGRLVPARRKTMRHRWMDTHSITDGSVVERCDHCDTERIPDVATKSLYLYRRGRAKPPNGKPMPDNWTGYTAGTVPRCGGRDIEMRTPAESSSP
jgi:hypothetical protein